MFDGTMAPIEACPVAPTDLLFVTDPTKKESELFCSHTVLAHRTVGISVRHIDGVVEEASTTVVGTELGGYIVDEHGKRVWLHDRKTLAISGVQYIGTSSIHIR